MDKEIANAKRRIIEQLENADSIDGIVVNCAIGVMGAFPVKEDCLNFMSFMYDKYLPPEKVEELRAKAKKKEE